MHGSQPRRPAPYRSAPDAPTGATGSRAFVVGGVAAIVLIVGLVAISSRGDRRSDGPTTVATPLTDAATTVPVQALAAPAAAPVDEQPSVDLDGCTIDVLSVAPGDSGDAVTCIQKALTVAGSFRGAITGTFDDTTKAAVEQLQALNGLYVDGIVGRQTATAMGIWPGDETFIVRTPPPPAGAVDLLGYPLSSVATAGADAPPLPPDSGEGTGRRIVYSRAAQRIWAVDDDENIVRSYLITGSQYNNEVPGKHEVYSRSEWTTAWNGQADLHYMVRWLDTERGAIGFHEIPVHRNDGSAYQTEAELGTRLSGGCQRQTKLDAAFMWHFGEIGTPVYVV